MDYTCSFCTKHNCKTGELKDFPANCPCNRIDFQNRIKKLYLDKTNQMLARNAALVEASGYCKWTRLEEIIQFAQKCNFTKLGVALCYGLRNEGKILCQILKDHGFYVESVICKNGGIPKEFIGVKDEEKVHPGNFEPMCNPIAQAMLLNDAGTQLNIIIGLCVGHDSLFIKYSKAPVTVFAVKDRVLAHNPLGAIYLYDTYYKDKLQTSK